MRRPIVLRVRGRPRMSAEEARPVLEGRFGVRGEVRALPSERDRNFAVLVDGEPRFVLRVANAAEDPLVLDLLAPRRRPAPRRRRPRPADRARDRRA